MPRTLAQNAQYIAETIKPAIKSAIEAQGVTVPSTDSFLDYADRIGEIEGGGSGYQLKDLPTGSISTVNDAAELPLNALTVSVEAVQEGTGDPSPSNIRPIIGWDSGEITADGKNLLSDNFVQGILDWNNTDNADNVGLINYWITSGYIPIKGGINIVLTAFRGKIVRYYELDANKKTLYFYGNHPVEGESVNRTTNEKAAYIRLSIGDDGVVTTPSDYGVSVYGQIELGTTATTYEPYQGKQYTLDFPTTIYSAEWDVVNGGMNNIDKKITISSGYSIAKDSTGFYIAVGDMKKLADYSNVIMCESLKVVANESALTDDCISGYNDSSQSYIGRNWIYFKVSGITTLEDLQTWLVDNPITLTYPLTTPTTIQLSPLSIRLLQGTNNIYADCGEVIEGEYFVDEGAIDVRKVDYQIGSSGSIKTTDGRVLSGFASMNGYHARPLDASGNWLDVDWSKDFEIGSAFKVLAFPSGGNATIFGCGVSGSMNYAPNVYFWNGSTAYITLSENGSSSAVDTALDYTFQTDTWYFVRAKFTKSTLNLKIEVSTDMSNFTTVYNDTLAAAPYHDVASICIGGMAQSANYASNSILIDTFNTYIKGDGVSWGAFTGTFPS